MRRAVLVYVIWHVVHIWFMSLHAEHVLVLITLLQIRNRAYDQSIDDQKPRLAQLNYEENLYQSIVALR